MNERRVTQSQTHRQPSVVCALLPLYFELSFSLFFTQMVWLHGFIPRGRSVDRQGSGIGSRRGSYYRHRQLLRWFNSNKSRVVVRKVRWIRKCTVHYRRCRQTYWFLCAFGVRIPHFQTCTLILKRSNPESILNKIFFYRISTAFKSYNQYSNTVKIPIYSLFITPGTQPILILICIHKPACHICIILIFLTCFQIRNLLLNPRHADLNGLSTHDNMGLSNVSRGQLLLAWVDTSAAGKHCVSLQEWAPGGNYLFRILPRQKLLCTFHISVFSPLQLLTTAVNCIFMASCLRGRGDTDWGRMWLHVRGTHEEKQRQ